MADETKPIDPTIGKDGKEYPLTLKQEAFVRAYIQNGGNGTEAYKQVYGCVGWAQNAINVAGSKMLAKPKVAARVAEMSQQAAGKVAVTAEWLMDRAIRRADAADADGDRTAATAADTLVAKLAQLLVDRVDQRVTTVTPSDHKPDLSALRRSAAQVSDADPDNTTPATSPVASVSTH